MDPLPGFGLARPSGLQREPSVTESKGRQYTTADVKQATEQFEALLIGQMLRHIRESGSGDWLGEGEDQAAGHLMGLAEEQLAQTLAAQDGLGLAQITASSVVPASTSQHNPAQDTAATAK